jgi:hypothetical protein
MDQGGRVASMRRSTTSLSTEAMRPPSARFIKPRGIVIAGLSTSFVGKQKMRDDFRRLNEGLKNVQIVLMMSYRSG